MLNSSNGVDRSYATVRSAQLKAVGTSFLKVRPLIVGCGMALVLPLLWASSAPVAQVIALGCGFSVMLGFFSYESWKARHAQVDERQLFISLMITIIGITMGSFITGAIRSPVLPLLFAPVITMFAAFGPGRESTSALIAITVVLIGLAIVPEGVPWPTIIQPYHAGMMWISTMLTVILLFVSVTSLTRAYRRSGQALDRMRLHVMEDAQSRLQGLEAVGAKVAHELKNPLASTKALVQLMARNSEKGSRDERRLEVLGDEVSRMELILEEYLSFARPLHELSLEDLELGALVEDTAEVVRVQASQNGVHIVCTIPEPLRLKADRSKLKQVLLNLVLNGIEASKNQGGGTLTITGKQEKGGVRLDVSDDGAGMNPETLNKLGTPFFTTREGGTGLGVVLAHSVVGQHGGRLHYESTPNEGTTASVWLPRVPGLEDVGNGDDSGS